jgi:hypothetical protein
LCKVVQPDTFKGENGGSNGTDIMANGGAPRVLWQVA